MEAVRRDVNWYYFHDGSLGSMVVENRRAWGTTSSGGRKRGALGCPNAICMKYAGGARLADAPRRVAAKIRFLLCQGKEITALDEQKTRTLEGRIGGRHNCDWTDCRFNDATMGPGIETPQRLGDGFFVLRFTALWQGKRVREGFLKRIAQIYLNWFHDERI